MQAIDTYAAQLSRQTRDAVLASGALTTEKRAGILGADFPDPDGLRRLAGAIKQHTIEHLGDYLGKAEQRLREGVLLERAFRRELEESVRRRARAAGES